MNEIQFKMPVVDIFLQMYILINISTAGYLREEGPVPL